MEQVLGISHIYAKRFDYNYAMNNIGTRSVTLSILSLFCCFLPVILATIGVNNGREPMKINLGFAIVLSLFLFIYFIFTPKPSYTGTGLVSYGDEINFKLTYIGYYLSGYGHMKSKAIAQKEYLANKSYLHQWL
jgi:hypothetical protein